MNKMQAVMELYQSIFPDAVLEKRGSWIRVNDKHSNNSLNRFAHSSDLLSEIWRETGNYYEWDSKNKVLIMIGNGIMNKMQAVIELYHSVFPDVLIEQKGTWISIDPCDGLSGPSSFRTHELLEEVFIKTGKSYYWNEEAKVLEIDAYDNDTWDTGNSWRASGYDTDRPWDQAIEILNEDSSKTRTMLCPLWDTCGLTGECPHSFRHEETDKCRGIKMNNITSCECPACEPYERRPPIHVTEPATGREILDTYRRYEEEIEEENLFDDIGEV